MFLSDSDDGSHILENMDVVMASISEFKVGDFVKMIWGYYVVVLDSTYGDEWEIQYWRKKYGKWVLNDLDSGKPVDMTKVDGRGHYTFSA